MHAKTTLPVMTPPANLQPRLFLLGLLVVAAIFHFVTMPRFPYQGDILAIKAETAQLVNTGRIGFSFSEKDQLGDLAEHSGQYFFPNQARQTVYSKYGLLYSLSYLPPLFLKEYFTGELPLVDMSEEMTLAGNCYNIVLSLLYLVYLYKIFFHFNRNWWQAALLAGLAVYPSYFWYYLRSPEKEIIQMVPFAGATYHMLKSLRASQQGQPSWKDLGLSLFWGGALYLLKPLYALLLLGIGMFAGHDLFWRYSGARGLSTPAGRNWLKSVATLMAMTSLIVALSLLHNFLRSGSFFDAGYRQDTTVPIEFVFTVEHFMRGLATYFVLPGNGNWFLHQPLLLAALVSYPSFYRRYRTESLFLLTVVLLHLATLCLHVEWIGEWCYGPRFCLHLVMLSIIPAVETASRLLAPGEERIKQLGRWLVMAVFSAMLLVSLRAQWYVQTWHYFTYFYLYTPFDDQHLEEATVYFAKMPHFACLNRDLSLYRQAGKKFPLLQAIDRLQLPASTTASIYTFIDESIDAYYWNYLLLKKPQ